jgi:hypothetical protein
LLGCTRRIGDAPAELDGTPAGFLVSFERELLDHYRLVFKKKPSPSG